MYFCAFRPKQFDNEEGCCDNRSASIIPDDMLPPSDDSSEEDNENVGASISDTVCNPNRPEIKFDDVPSSDSENSDNGDHLSDGRR